jgi:hypothetical protein
MDSDGPCSALSLVKGSPPEEALDPSPPHLPTAAPRRLRSCLFLRQRNRAPRRTDKRTAPPTIPPAMAAAWVFLEVGGGICEGVGVLLGILWRHEVSLPFAMKNELEVVFASSTAPSRIYRPEGTSTCSQVQFRAVASMLSESVMSVGVVD